MLAIALFFARKGVPQTLVKPLAWLTAIMGVIALLGLLWGLATCAVHRHDKGVINDHENIVQAQVANEVSAGTNVADAADNRQAAEDAVRANAVEVAINNAVTAHPVETHRAAGPASQAALNALRKRNGR